MVAAIAETLTMKTHLGILGFVASFTQYLNKSQSSTRPNDKISVCKRRFLGHFEISGGLPLYTRSQTPVPRSPFPVLVTSDESENLHIITIFLC